MIFNERWFNKVRNYIILSFFPFSLFPFWGVFFGCPQTWPPCHSTLDQVFCLYAKSPLVDVVFILVIVVVLTTCPSSSSSVASMFSEVLVFIGDKGKSANIPDCTTIIKQCFELGPGQATATNISGVWITLEKSSDHDVSDIWVVLCWPRHLNHVRKCLCKVRTLKPCRVNFEEHPQETQHV